MAEREPEDIDNLFQQGLDRPPFDYNPVAWSDMERLLERERRRRRWAWWYFCLLIGLGGVAGFFTWRQSDVKQPAQHPIQAPTEQALPRAQPTSPEPTSSPTPSAPPQDAHAARSTAPTRSARGLLAPQAAAPNAATAQASTVRDNDMPAKTDFSKPLFSATDTTANLQPNSSPNTVGSGPAPADSAALAPAPIRDALADAPLRPLDVLWTDSLASDTAADKLPIQPVVLPPRPTVDKRPDTRGWTVALMGGVEWNAVGISPFDSMGWRVGAHVEYRFARHWSLGTGLQYSKRNYGAGPGEFHPPYDWIYGIAPTAVKGHCNMLEAPLQISYYPRANNRPGWVFTGGVQAYWVLLETYHYDYDVNYPGQIYAWTGEKTSRSIPGFAYASAGYQWRVHRRLMAELAPYVQAPLQGMGTGKLEVFSFGVNVRVKWMGGATD
jgi:hypothetical protein